LTFHVTQNDIRRYIYKNNPYLGVMCGVAVRPVTHG